MSGEPYFFGINSNSKIAGEQEGGKAKPKRIALIGNFSPEETERIQQAIRDSEPGEAKPEAPAPTKSKREWNEAIAKDALTVPPGDDAEAPAPQAESECSCHCHGVFNYCDQNPPCCDEQTVIPSLLEEDGRCVWCDKVYVTVERTSQPSRPVEAQPTLSELQERARRELTSPNGEHTAASVTDGWWTMDEDTLVRIMADFAFAAHLKGE